MTDRRDLVAMAVAVVATASIAATPIAGLTTPGRYAVATMAFAAVLWVTGALPLPATALAIPVLLVGFGVYPDLGDAVAGFADPVIFLLLAGFVLAEAMAAHGIDRRIAYTVLARVGTSPGRLVLAVMVATAGLSMVVSNTATVAMMVPITIGLVGQVTDVARTDRGGTASNLQLAALLGTAYAASLGGVGTLIGTPPNAIVVGQLRELVGVRITFVDWLAIGMPMVVVTLPVAWYLLLRVYPPEVTDVTEARERAAEELREAGSLSRAAEHVVIVFALTAGLWLLGGLGFLVRPYLPAAWYVTLFGGEGPTVLGTVDHQGLLYFVLVGLLAVLALFLLGAITWEDAADIDWGTLVLLGGGISLANALADTNATAWLAEVTIGALAGAPVLLVIGAVIGLTVLVGELASNTAMAALIVPLLVDVGPAYAAQLGGATTASVTLALAGAVAASYGFALPVATPPNAIVFGAGYMRREHMLRAGLPLDVVVIGIATLVLSLLVRFVWPAVL